MDDPIYEECLVAKHQNRLRAALSKLSDVCNRNSKLTETVAGSGTFSNNTKTKSSSPAPVIVSSLNYKSCNNDKTSVCNKPPTPPTRTVSLFRIKERESKENWSKTSEKLNNKSGNKVSNVSLGKEKPRRETARGCDESRRHGSNIDKTESNDCEMICKSAIEKCKAKHKSIIDNQLMEENIMSMSPAKNDENVIDPGTETDVGDRDGPSESLSQLANCESAVRVRKSLENISVPSWYQKYETNNINKSHKWRHIRAEEGGWRRQNSVNSLLTVSRSPSPSTRSSWSTRPSSSRTSPCPSYSSYQLKQHQENRCSSSKATNTQTLKSLPPIPSGKQYLGWRKSKNDDSNSKIPIYLQSPSQRLARSYVS